MKKSNKSSSVWTMLLTDLLLAALIVAGWAGYRMLSINLAATRFEAARSSRPAESLPTSAPVSDVTPSAAPEPQQTPAPVEGAAPTEAPGPEPAPPAATPAPPQTLRERFAEHFTDTVVSAENAYSSPGVSVTLSSGTYESSGGTTAYYVADIYLADPEYLQSYFAHNAVYPNRTALMPNMMRECGAVVGINGDYCGLNFGGIILRNGISYMNAPNGCDLLIMYRSGEMECIRSADYDESNYDLSQILHIWSFGPALLDSEGGVIPENELNMFSYIAGINPRTAIGYYEPGHYCFVVADGRQGSYSAGLLMPELAEIMHDLGCRLAYNLDGGGSSMMMLGERFVNRPSTDGQRDVTDIIVIRDLSVESETDSQ